MKPAKLANENFDQSFAESRNTIDSRAGALNEHSRVMELYVM
jgi:hypothetical protein